MTINAIKVLLVEDNPTEVELLRVTFSSLTDKQFSLTHKERLSDALDFLQDNLVDVVLLDLGLPDSQGVDTFLKLHEEVPHIPILVLTSLNDESVGISALREGAQDYLVKMQVEGPLLSRSIRYAIERHHLHDQIMHATRMESIGRLSSGIAHDFNNILAVINGNCELMLGDLVEKDPFRQKINEVLQAGLKASGLISQLLLFSRKALSEPKIIQLNDIIKNMNKMLQRLIRADIALNFIEGPQLHPVQADPTHIDQVILNLAINARDAMPGGGTLTIETKNCTQEDLEPGVKFGDYILLIVSDTGMGMNKEVMSHIFEPFFTTKDIGKGTGLGLSTVFGIVKQMDGFITVDSQPGKGSSFKIYIPCLKDSIVVEEKIEQTDANKFRGKETILVTEDDASVRRYLRELLERFGYTVFEASNVSEALNQFKKASPDLIISDVVMPGQNGYELYKKISHLNPKIPFLFISGYTSHNVLEENILKKGMHFLQKPFTSLSLLRELRYLLDRNELMPLNSNKN